MPPFLLDANLSPETTSFLVASFGLDVTDLMSRGLSHLRDIEVVECRVIVVRQRLECLDAVARARSG